MFQNYVAIVFYTYHMYRYRHNIYIQCLGLFRCTIKCPLSHVWDLKGLQKQLTSKVRARGKGVSKNRSFRACALNEWPQDCLHYFLYDIQRNVSRAECTKTWESRPSKDHQCLYWLSCAVKVLIKNAKSVIFTTVKGKRLITNLPVVDPP